MTTQRASDLSPAQVFFIELMTHSPATPLERSSELISVLFSEALRWCDLNTAPDSWQRKRIYALLSPMYLEVMMEIQSSVQRMRTEQIRSEQIRAEQSRVHKHLTDRPVELLLARTRWTHEACNPLEQSLVSLSLTPKLQEAIRDAAHGMIELAREVISE